MEMYRVVEKEEKFHDNLRREGGVREGERRSLLTLIS